MNISTLPWLRQLRFLLIFAVISTLIACSGDDGEGGVQGPQGPQGEQGPSGITPPSAIPSAFSGNFTDITISAEGVVVANFEMQNESGHPFIGLNESDLSFTISQLIPEDETGLGNPSAWKSYIHSIESAPTDPANGPGTEDKTQADTDSDGTLVDNGDGSYQYTFGVNVNSVTEPVAVTYNAEFTHRVAMAVSVRGGLPAFNMVYSWQPSTGAIDNIQAREMIDMSSCNNCHGAIEFHGGSAIDSKYCVTCHTPEHGDANSGNTLDFKVLVHKLHRGKNLHQVQDGGEYAVWGFRDRKHDYSEVSLPQDIRNCTNCHDENNTNTPQASNWYLKPSIETCSTCHDNLDFTIAGTEPNGHPGGPQADNALCANCHGPNGGFPVKDNHTDVLVNQQLGADKLAITIDSVALDGAKNLTVNITMMLDGVPLTDYASIQPFINSGDGELMVNYDDGTGYQFAYSSPEGGFKPGTNGIFLSTCTHNGDGKYSCLRPDSAGASFGDSGTIATTFFEMPLCTNEKSSNGQLIDCATVETSNTRVALVPFNTPRKFFNLDGSEATDYVEKVGADTASCNSCHANLAIHITSHAAQDFNQCTSCHNATKVAWYEGRPGDLKSHVHSFHAGADSTSDHNIEAPYPMDISNCNACHSEAQIDLPLTANPRASKARVAPNADKGTPEFITFTSGTAVVCSSCHIKVPVGYIDPSQPGYVNIGASDEIVLSSEDQSLVTHMVTNGAVFGASTFDDANIVEACAVCHGAGNSVGIDTVHNIQ